MEVTSNVEEVFSQLSVREMRHIKEMSDYYAKAFNNIGDVKKAMLALYATVDRNNEEHNKKIPEPTSCKKGCSFCCNILVQTSQPEVDLIVDYMKAKKIKVSKQTLEEQTKLDISTYVLSPHRKCVFLSADGLCKVYEVRPFACRNYFVISPAEQCNTDEYPKGGTISSMNYDTFAMYNWVIDQYPGGNLPILLLNTLKKKFGFLK